MPGERLLAAAASALLVGMTMLACGNSCPATPTEDLILYTDAVASGDGTTELRTILSSCGGGPLADDEYARVGCGDQMFATAGDFRVELEPGFDGPNPTFSGTLPVSDEGTSIEMRLVRPEFEDPLVGRSSLPPPFDITSDPPASPLSRSTDSLEIRWTPSGGADRMFLFTDFTACTGQNVIEVPDTGAFVVGPHAIQGFGQAECDLALRLRRIRQGPEPGCGESVVYALQERIIPVTSVP